MGWFDEQIRERAIGDEIKYSQAFDELEAAVSGRAQNQAKALSYSQSALADIAAYYGASPHKIKGEKDKDKLRNLLENQYEETGIMYREVYLTPHWQKDAFGALLGFLSDGTPVALIPHKGGYAYKDHNTGKTVTVTAEIAAQLDTKAFCFYRPLPNKKLAISDLLLYLMRSLDWSDYLFIIIAMGISTVLGLFLPVINKVLFGPVIDQGNLSVIAPVAVMLLSISFAQIILMGVNGIISSRVVTKCGVSIKAAAMMRLLKLPTSFFQQRTPGEILSRMEALDTLIGQLQSVLFGSVLSALFSFVYIIQMLSFTPTLVMPALLISLLMLVAGIGLAFASLNHERRVLDAGMQLQAWENGIIGGIQKIRLAGAEKRAFATWAGLYSKLSGLKYGNPGPAVLIQPLLVFVGFAGSMLIYFNAIRNGISVADYMAFSSIFGIVISSVSSLAAAGATLFSIRPNFAMVDPILNTKPENNEQKGRAGRIGGNVSLSHVRFTYPGEEKPLFTDLTLNIASGDYVAIVGKTGCGKSSILRLLLGFETPQKGGVYYDGVDIKSFDLTSLRRQIGVVLQNGSLFQGDIYHNMSICNPDLTMEQAWEIAESVGLKKDIEAMPMGMQTQLSQGGGGISGGQRQRLMIARALASHPRILILDEATSALDNITQRQVSETLDSLKCTRIVIAHRLSTIRNCNRILVLDEGAIVEDGSYDELMKQQGAFYQLVERQKV